MQWRNDSTFPSRGLYQGQWASRVKPPNDRLGSARQMSGCTSGGTTRNPPRDFACLPTATATCDGNLDQVLAGARTLGLGSPQCRAGPQGQAATRPRDVRCARPAAPRAILACLANRDSLARPGGNASEFITLEYGLSAKWVDTLPAT
jgi:hypothetical protein